MTISYQLAHIANVLCLLLKLFGYTYEVILPEIIVWLLMDVHQMSYEEVG